VFVSFALLTLIWQLCPLVVNGNQAGDGSPDEDDDDDDWVTWIQSVEPATGLPSDGALADTTATAAPKEVCAVQQYAATFGLPPTAVNLATVAKSDGGVDVRRCVAGQAPR
jgi:hypothetical protein